MSRHALWLWCGSRESRSKPLPSSRAILRGQVYWWSWEHGSRSGTTWACTGRGSSGNHYRAEGPPEDGHGWECRMARCVPPLCPPRHLSHSLMPLPRSTVGQPGTLPLSKVESRGFKEVQIQVKKSRAWEKNGNLSCTTRKDQIIKMAPNLIRTKQNRKK